MVAFSVLFNLASVTSLPFSSSAARGTVGSGVVVLVVVVVGLLVLVAIVCWGVVAVVAGAAGWNSKTH